VTETLVAAARRARQQAYARRWAVPAFLALVALLSGACSERLLTPVNCPELCPGGQIVVYDTTLTPIVGGDSSFSGYVSASTSTAFLVSNDLPAANARGFARFARRGDSVIVQDTLRSYTLDSVKVILTIQSRDSAQDGLALLLYKLPPTIDSSTTFAELAAALTPGALIDSVPVPDSLINGAVTALFADSTLARVALTPADSGVLRLGVALAAPAPTGVRIGTPRAGSGAPVFLSYVHADVPDTALQRQVITRTAVYTTYLTAVPFPLPTPPTLVVGGAPSSRALIRFALPAVLKDTAEIIRASLELVPVTPILGLANISSTLVAVGLLSDLGAKSPTTSDITASATFSIPTGNVLSIEVLRILKLWQGTNGRPSALFVALTPEGSSFSVPVFGSSSGDPAYQPRLRIEYVRPYGFTRP
jgi:hypothetical protein